MENIACSRHLSSMVARRDAGEDGVTSEGASPGGRSLKRLKAPSVIKESIRSGRCSVTASKLHIS